MDDTSMRVPATAAAQGRARGSIGLIAVGLALVALGAWGHLNPQGFVWVDRLLDHVVAFGGLAVMLVVWGLARLSPRPWWRLVVLVPGAIAFCVWGLFGYLVVVGGGIGAGDSVATAEPPGARYAAVVRASSVGFIDPAWIVSIQQTEGLTAREFEVGCINGDDPQYSFLRIRWADPEHLTVRLSAHTVTVEVDPATGEPRPVRGRVWSTC